MARRRVLMASSWACALLACAPAWAADLANKAPPAPAGAGTWTGFYLGSFVGAGMADTYWLGAGPPRATTARQQPSLQNSGSGGLIGAQLGYNYQIGALVLGIEADAGAGFQSATVQCLRGWASTCTTDTDVLGTLAARVGYAFDNLLLYGKVGAALTHESYTIAGNTYAGQFTGTQTRAGWTAGGGVEMALTPQFSVKAEYAFLDFGESDTTLVKGSDRIEAQTSASAQMVKLGLNYRPFGAPLPGTGPLPASPGRDWSGVYLGAFAGGAWGRNDWADGTGLFAAASAGGNFPGASAAQGLVGGGQIGFNTQFGAWVAGIEASAGASTLGGDAKCAVAKGSDGNFACRDAVKSLGTLTGQLGRSFGDALVYGKAGAAWAFGSGSAHDTNEGPVYADSGVRWGWLLGGGIAYALTGNVSAFIEYDYMDFGTQELSFSAAGRSGTARFSQQLDLVRAGLNYRFADAPPKADPGARLPDGWSAEIGARYFASTGRSQKDLFGMGTQQALVSRLIYANATGQAAEAFFRLENRNGLFLKGYAGLGTLAGGSLNDEDYPAEKRYSNTHSRLSAGHLSYGALDLGYDVLRQGQNSLGAFVGYRGFFARVDGYGCRQIATDETCDDAATRPSNINALGLSETETWQGVALGLNARLQLSDRMRLELDAAYLPYATMSGYDNHWARADINPLAESGRGWGTQLEAVLNYAVTDRLDVGIGARYWFFQSSTAYAQFDDPKPQAVSFYSERYGGFLQASYRFGDVPPLDGRAGAARAPAAPHDWTGLYAGANLGGGKGHSTYASPFAPPVSGDAADLGGATAGLQLGGNYQTGALVLGAEVSAAWADVGGTNTCFSTAPAGPHSGFNCGSRVEALGTLTGRVGYAVERTLLYARGGFAWGRQDDAFNTFHFDKRIPSQASTNTGWMIGAGLEYALLPDLSVGVEYRHFEFGGSPPFTTAAVPALAGVNLAPDSLRLDMVSLSVNYRFAAFASAP